MSRVSVVIPLHDAAPYIAETLDSVAAQTLPAHEVIVVDDGSRDGGAEVAERHPLGPRVIRQANGGPAKARNAGVRASSGELLAFLDADDLWTPRKLERQVEAIERDPEVGLVFGDFELFTGEPAHRRFWGRSRPTKDISLRGFLWSHQATVITWLMPRAVFDAVGPFNEDPYLIGTEDSLFALHLLERHRAIRLPEVLAYYRCGHPSLIGGQRWSRGVAASTRPVARFLSERPGLSYRLFGLPAALFLRVRITRALLGSIKHRSCSWSERLAVLRHLVSEIPLSVSPRWYGRHRGESPSFARDRAR
jgi:glycosyltransferase involved in cell wall biosynthesis